MGRKKAKEDRGLNWIAKSSLVLIFTIILSIFIGYSSKQAQAAVSTTTEWAILGSSATTIASLPAMSLAKGTGSNRLLVVSLIGDYSAATTTFQPTITYGGQTLTRITSTDTSSRQKVWIGYLNEAGVAAATGAPPAFAVSGVSPDTGCALSAAFYDGVLQATPITGSRAVSSDTAATTPTSSPINTTNGGWAIYSLNTNSSTAGNVTVPANYTERFDTVNGTLYTFTMGSTTAATTGATTDPLPTWTSVRYAFLTASLAPGATGNLTVADGTNPANANAPQSSTNNALDGFTLAMSAGSATVSTMTVTGSANFNATNIPTNGVKIYEDFGTIGTFDGADILVSSASTAIAANVTTVTVSSEAVTATPANYLVTVDMNAGAVLTNTFTATVTAATGSGLGTPTYTDSASATLTVTAAQTLTIGNGTNPANANARQSSFNNALNAFTLSLNSGSGTISTMTVTGSANFNATNIPTNGVKIYEDFGTIGTFDGADVLVSSASTAIATNATTVTVSSEAVTATPANYLVTVDLNAGAVLTNTFTGTISAATGSAIGTPVDSDTSSATLTVIVAGASSTINSCAGCHDYGATYADGTARNTPAGHFPGSHNKHVATYGKLCSVCHVAPATETSADYDHRDTNITMANPINGNLTAAYTKGTSWAQTNSPTAFTGCTSTYCHSNGTSVVSGTIPANTSTTWAGTTTCQSCHGAGGNDDGRPNYVNNTPKRNTHGDGASYGVTHKATACPTCHTGVSGSAGAYTISTPGTHDNGVYNLQATLGYTQATGVCSTPGCHGSATWGATLSCVDCHAAQVTSTVASGLGGPATRPDIVTSFGLTSKHTRSRGTAVTANDCGVCHMEGTAATGAINATYHKNGYVELRDPDLGTTIKGVTHSGTTSAPGVYTSTGVDARPLRFSRNLASATIEADTAAIMVNMCLKCHDTVGAGSALAIVPGGTAGKPFAGTVAANPSGNVLDVAAQFASTNRSFHPVLVRQNNGYLNTGGTRMVTPWNGVATTATTTVYGPLISCWDCHAPNAATGTLTASGIHGGTPNSTDAVPLRGNVYTAGTTAATNLCINCHVVNGGTTNHGTGSAITSSTNSGMTYFQNRCSHCHASDYTRTRPWGAGDTHGYSARGGTIGNNQAFPVVNNGYAFIRSEGWYGNAYQHSIRSIGATTYTPTCNGRGTAGGGTGSCSRSSMGGYTPGGVY